MDPKVNILPPIGHGLGGYDRRKRHNEQPLTVPSVFIDAMSVRETVFVDEQHCPLELEFDDNDPRAFQWTLHATLPTSSRDDPLPSDSVPSKRQSRILAGTLRIVPPPHQSYPLQPDHGTAEDASATPLHPSSPTDNPNDEPYFMLGRLAFMPAFRGTGMAKLLVDLALGYTAQNPETVLPKDSTGGNGDWKGLVLVHAQKPLEGLYARWGFARDEGMGVWLEEGIEHVGMWRRMDMGEGSLTNPSAKAE